jgi:hypothetical protein
MKTILPFIALTIFAAPFVRAQEKEMFNGKDLTGWEGVPELWSVQDGAITGKTTKEVPAKENTFLVWKGGDVSDFEMTFKFKLVPGDEKGFANSGVQYRSTVVKPEYFVVAGYQADMEAGKTYSGILYEEKRRGILAKRGEKVVITNVEKDPSNPKSKNFKIEVTGSVGDSNEIEASIKKGDWNDYKIVAKGNHLQQWINGHQTIDVTDETMEGAKSGVLALQLHAGPPMMAQFKDMKIKELK